VTGAKPGEQGREQARRRFGSGAVTSAAERTWTLEDLLAGNGAVGAAHAAARRGNRSAVQALRDLKSALAGVESEAAGDGNHSGGDTE